MYLPRRFRRRLLLPPGWVALGFLLLLGCLAVQGQWRRLPTQQESVTLLTMPTLNQKGDASETGPFTLRSARQAIYQVQHWKRLAFTGHSSDSLVLKQAAHAIAMLDDWTQPSKGVAISFSGRTQYRYLVEALSLCRRYDINKYMLDNYEKPVTLYVLNPYFRPRPRHHPMPLVRPFELR